MQDNDKEKFAFINEKIKEKPLKKKRMVICAIFCVILAVVFGLVASLVFTIAQPKMEEYFYPKQDPVVSIPKDEPTEETEAETETENTEQSEQDDTQADTEGLTEDDTEGNTAGDLENGGEIDITNTYGELSLESFQQLQNQMYDVGREANRFIVTVTGVKSDIDWFNNAYESKGQASGIIIADNGEELLILTERKAIADAQELFVTFIDDTSAMAEVKKYDGNTGITVLSVPRSEVSEETMNAIKIATLGNSFQITQGTIVMAVGSPLGTNYSILTGNVTATDNTISTIDANYKVFTTDIVGSKDGSGALINVQGEVIGLVMQDYSSTGEENTLTAVAISELKALIEMLSNGKDIPYIGLDITTVTSAIAKEYDIPKGAYVKAVEMDSPAMAAGIQSGDVLTEVDGLAIYTAENYESKLLTLNPEETIKLVISRQGNEGYTEIECEVYVSVLQ